jgi:hypothetical protein
VEHFGYRPDTTQFLVQSGIDYDFTVDLDSLATMTLSAVRTPKARSLPGATVQILETPLATAGSDGRLHRRVPPASIPPPPKFNYTMATDTLTAEAALPTPDFTIPVGMDDDWFDQADQPARRQRRAGVWNGAIPCRYQHAHGAAGRRLFT